MNLSIVPAIQFLNGDTYYDDVAFQGSTTVVTGQFSFSGEDNVSVIGVNDANVGVISGGGGNLSGGGSVKTNSGISLSAEGDFGIGGKVIVMAATSWNGEGELLVSGSNITIDSFSGSSSGNLGSTGSNHSQCVGLFLGEGNLSANSVNDAFAGYSGSGQGNLSATAGTLAIGFSLTGEGDLSSQTVTRTITGATFACQATLSSVVVNSIYEVIGLSAVAALGNSPSIRTSCGITLESDASLSSRGITQAIISPNLSANGNLVASGFAQFTASYQFTGEGNLIVTEHVITFAPAFAESAAIFLHFNRSIISTFHI